MVDRDDQSRDLIEVLGEEFTQRLRQGEHPSIEEYALQHPSRADDIRELLPAIVALEQMRARQRRDGRVELNDRPQQLGDFRLLSEIGRGGMGVVYEAEQISLGRRVAVKVLPRDTSPAAARRAARFDREARAAAQLHHSNIVPVFGVGEEDGYHYLVMQRIDGLPLDRILSRRALEESETVSRTRSKLSNTVGEAPVQTGAMAEQPSASQAALPVIANAQQYWDHVAASMSEVAEALHYAHQHGILHRDIKPANLLLDRQDVLWIADFGLAQIREMDISQSQDLAGTLRYMAPERLDGKCDERSDVYSLGVTLYEMLSLRPAFEAVDRGVMIREITESGPAPLRQIRPTIPRDLETIVMKALALAPRDRYVTALELAEDLRRFHEDRPVLARRATPLEKAWRWCRRNRAVALSASTALIMLVIATVASTAAYYRTHSALQQTLREQQRTRDAMALSFDAYEELFSNFAPDDLFMASLPTVDSGDATGLASTTERPVLSPQIGEILKSVLKVYDQYAQQIGQEEETLRRKLIASGRLGAIQARLAQFDQAEETFLSAIEAWPDDPDDIGMQIEKAKVLNSLGGLYDVQQRRGESQAAYYEALAAIEHIETDDPQLFRAKSHQMAQSHFLLGRAFFVFGSRWRPPQQRRDHLNEALQILEPLIQATNDRSSRRLKALCLREYDPDPATDNVDQAIRILSELSKEDPNNLSFRYDLSETLGLPAPRRASALQLELARSRLLDALGLAEELKLRQPSVPLYAESKSHLHRKLADVLLRLGERIEAAQHASLAVSEQEALRRQFPDSIHYRVWTAVFVEMRARVQEDEADLELARYELQSVVDELTELWRDQPDSTFVLGPLSSAYLTLARIQFEQFDTESAFQSLEWWRVLRELTYLH